MTSSDDPQGGDRPEERRRHERYASAISVDYSSGDNFLFAYIQNISQMGIFIRTDDPLPIGSAITMRFGSQEVDLELEGEVVWINPVRLDGNNINPGMGIEFRRLSGEQRERIVDIVRTVAYLRDDGDHLLN